MRNQPLIPDYATMTCDFGVSLSCTVRLVRAVTPPEPDYLIPRVLHMAPLYDPVLATPKQGAYYGEHSLVFGLRGRAVMEGIGQKQLIGHCQQLFAAFTEICCEGLPMSPEWMLVGGDVILSMGDGAMFPNYHGQMVADMAKGHVTGPAPKIYTGNTIY